jgi:hypothetical protein
MSLSADLSKRLLGTVGIGRDATDEFTSEELGCNNFFSRQNE